jgi:hypothetical protein
LQFLQENPGTGRRQGSPCRPFFVQQNLLFAHGLVKNTLSQAKKNGHVELIHAIARRKWGNLCSP